LFKNTSKIIFYIFKNLFLILIFQNNIKINLKKPLLFFFKISPPPPPPPRKQNRQKLTSMERSGLVGTENKKK